MWLETSAHLHDCIYLRSCIHLSLQITLQLKLLSATADCFLIFFFSPCMHQIHCVWSHRGTDPYQYCAMDFGSLYIEWCKKIVESKVSWNHLHIVCVWCVTYQHVGCACRDSHLYLASPGPGADSSPELSAGWGNKPLFSPCRCVELPHPCHQMQNVSHLWGQKCVCMGVCLHVFVKGLCHHSLCSSYIIIVAGLSLPRTSHCQSTFTNLFYCNRQIHNVLLFTPILLFAYSSMIVPWQ